MAGWAAGGVLLGVLLVLAPLLLNDPDTYWHVAVGRDVLASGSLPSVDTYSWTMAGEPWIAKEWLSQVVYAAAFRAGGWAGVSVVAAVAAALAFGLLASFLSARLELTPTVVLLGLAFVVAAPHLLARPHVLALPLLVTWTVLLVGAADGSRRPPWWALLLMVLWANLHGSFLLGLALAAGLGLDAVVAATPRERSDLGRQWGGFVLLAVAATLVTPYGWGTLLAAAAVLRLGSGLAVVAEWQPADFADPSGLEVVVVAAVAALLVSRFRLRWPRALVVLALLVLALSAVRNGDVLGLVAPVVIATPLAAHLEQSPRPSTSSPWLAAGLVALLVTPLAVVSLRNEDRSPAPRHSPVAAVAVLEDLDLRRVLNDYAFGGYLIHVGVPTYIDGRTELFGAAAVVAHDAAVRADPPGVLLELLERDEVQATLLQPGSPALAHLDASDGWQRVHTDETAVLHTRVVSSVP